MESGLSHVLLYKTLENDGSNFMPSYSRGRIVFKRLNIEINFLGG